MQCVSKGEGGFGKYYTMGIEDTMITVALRVNSITVACKAALGDCTPHGFCNRKLREAWYTLYLI